MFAVFAYLITIVAAVSNYCMFSTFEDYSLLGTKNYGFDAIFLFTEDSCTGTTCTFTSATGALTRAQVNQRSDAYYAPIAGPSYVCDGASHLSPSGSGKKKDSFYVCTCAGTFASSIPHIDADGNQVVLSCGKTGNSCGPFPKQQYYCTTSGSHSNDVRTDKFSTCSVFASCSGATCLNGGTDDNRVNSCDGVVSDTGSIVFVGGTSASDSGTSSCHDCQIDPALSDACRAKYAAGGLTVSSTVRPTSTPSTTARVTSQIFTNPITIPTTNHVLTSTTSFHSANVLGTTSSQVAIMTPLQIATTTTRSSSSVPSQPVVTPAALAASTTVQPAGGNAGQLQARTVWTLTLYMVFAIAISI